MLPQSAVWQLIMSKCGTEVLPQSAVLQWMKEQGIFVPGFYINYSYYVNYDDCGTAVAAFGNT